jgi:hypothetical protein
VGCKFFDSFLCEDFSTLIDLSIQEHKQEHKQGGGGRITSPSSLSFVKYEYNENTPNHNSSSLSQSLLSSRVHDLMYCSYRGRAAPPKRLSAYCDGDGDGDAPSRKAKLLLPPNSSAAKRSRTCLVRDTTHVVVLAKEGTSDNSNNQKQRHLKQQALLLAKKKRERFEQGDDVERDDGGTSKSESERNMRQRVFFRHLCGGSSSGQKMQWQEEQEAKREGKGKKHRGGLCTQKLLVIKR